MAKEWTCAGCGRADCEHPDCDTCAHAEATRLRAENARLTAENAALVARAEKAEALAASRPEITPIMAYDFVHHAYLSDWSRYHHAREALEAHARKHLKERPRGK